MTEGARPNLTLNEELAAYAVELLSDGNWHPYVQVLNLLMARVPPGIAIRQAEKLRQKTRNDHSNGVPAARTRGHESEHRIRVGARDLVRRFLANPRVYEIDKTYRSGARPLNFVDDRKIRMVNLPRRAIPLGPSAQRRVDRDQRRLDYETVINRQQNEIEHLKDQIAAFRVYLIGLGHEARADEIAPPSEEDHSNESRRPW